MAGTVQVIRVGEDEYPEFSRLLEWRRTGEEQVDTSSYLTDRTQAFLRKYNVLSSETFFIYAARAEGRYVGYITAIVIPKPDPRPGMFYVDELWVAEPYRHAGIATLLMNEALRVARRLELWTVRLYVGMDNLAARSYYRKMGFEEKGDAVWCEIDARGRA
jgi:ribosomal protein S18 acetylase RimI-like enzyme